MTTHAGFDVSRYPGDAALTAWAHGGSPYEWAGYYLAAPCHRDTTWAGKRTTVESLGLGTTVIYVGQQTWDGVPELLPPSFPPGISPDLVAATRMSIDTMHRGAVQAGPTCSRTLLSAAQGTLEAADAVTQAAAQGFPVHSVIFLDVEHMDSIPASMLSYYRAWLDGVLQDGRYRPGTYAHHANAAALFAVARDAYTHAGRSETPPFWIAGGTGFSLASRATDVGLDFAAAWQGALDVTRVWNGTTLVVDESVSDFASPSAPDAVR